MSSIEGEESSMIPYIHEFKRALQENWNSVFLGFTFYYGTLLITFIFILFHYDPTIANFDLIDILDFILFFISPTWFSSEGLRIELFHLISFSLAISVTAFVSALLTGDPKISESIPIISYLGVLLFILIDIIILVFTYLALSETTELNHLLPSLICLFLLSVLPVTIIHFILSAIFAYLGVKIHKYYVEQEKRVVV